MARIYGAEEADTGLVMGSLIAVIGYGNQGRAQALNLRDTGLRVVVGNVEDEYARQAQADGFSYVPIAEAARAGDVVLLLLPDEVAPDVFEAEVRPGLAAGKLLVFASGFNVHFSFIRPPTGVDVALVAPHMIGKGVRELFNKGRGFPVLVGVAQDATGKAEARALALAKAIGALAPGGCAVASSFAEETLVDLFGEHSWAGAILYMLRAAYEALVEAGVSPEVAILDLYASGELGAIGQAMAEMGLWGQICVHSHTSQYGQMSWGHRYVTEETRRVMREAIADIKNGAFAQEWEAERARGMATLAQLLRSNTAADLFEQEERLYRLLGRRPQQGQG